MTLTPKEIVVKYAAINGVDEKTVQDVIDVIEYNYEKPLHDTPREKLVYCTLEDIVNFTERYA